MILKVSHINARVGKTMVSAWSLLQHVLVSLENPETIYGAAPIKNLGVKRRYYLCSWGQVLLATSQKSTSMVPTKKKHVSYIANAATAKIILQVLFVTSH